jgi:phage terminase large subunit-like protein
LPQTIAGDEAAQVQLDWLTFQREFLEDWHHLTQYECWGVGTGKSVSGAGKALLCALRWPGTNVGCIEPTGKMLDQIMIPALNEVIESFKAVNGFDPVQKRVAFTRTWTLFNGSKLVFFSAHKPERILGATLGAAWLDEESSYVDPENLLRVVRARLRGRGPRIVWATSTPNGRQGLLAEILEAEAAGDQTVSLRVHPTWDNPHLPEGFVEQMRRTYSAAMFEQEVEAKISSAANLVLAKFDRRLHVRRFERSRLKTEPWDLCIGIDWSGGHADGAIVWAAVSTDHKNGDELPWFVVLDEWIGVATVPQMIARVCASFNRYPKPPAMICPDPADFDAVADLRIEVRKLLKRSCVKWEQEPRRRRVTFGVELLNRLMAVPDESVPPHFWIDDSLINSAPNGIVGACENYRTRNGKIHDDNHNTHIVDAVRMIALNCHRIGHRIRGAKLPEGASMRLAAQEGRDESDD